MIMYELLSLKLPYHEYKKSWNIADAVMNGTLPNLPPLKTAYDPLVLVFRKCLSMTPHSRPNAGKLLASLRLLKEKYAQERLVINNESKI